MVVASASNECGNADTFFRHGMALGVGRIHSGLRLSVTIFMSGVGKHLFFDFVVKEYCLSYRYRSL